VALKFEGKILLKESELSKIVQEVFKETKLTKNINIRFISEGAIRALNKKYRKNDTPTDVLSFNYGSESDIVVAPRQVQKLKDNNETMEDAIKLTLIHGVLHSLGYDHESESDRIEMRKIERIIKKRIG